MDGKKNIDISSHTTKIDSQSKDERQTNKENNGAKRKKDP